VVILLYHRITELPLDPWLISVSPCNFAEHLEILQQYNRPVRLQQVSEALRHKELPDQSVVITFDDGYADNLYNAKLLLERYDVPATFFLTTGNMRCESEFWWDELERVLLHPGSLPDVLDLSINGITHRWKLGEAAHYSEEAFRRYRCWRAWEDGPSLRHSLYSQLWELLHTLPEGERRRVMNDILRWAEAEPAVRPTHRPLSPEEAFTLSQGELMEIGAHTVTHPALSALTRASQRDEILKSRSYLQEIVGCPVTSFAYPYGRRSDYNAETISIVRQAGFTCSCSNFGGIVNRATDPFQLPRVQVQNWGGDEFAKLLRRWFDG